MILSTITSADALKGLTGGLAPNGKLVILGAPEKPWEISAFDLIGEKRSIMGWPSGSGMDSEDTMKFSVLTGVEPMIETFPLEQAQQAYERMMTGEARFRVVIKVAD